ncbi:MAG: hypothetical protein Q8L48_36475 [Archangium sp.]|nr:hypothetical protein [Archangium sp.]
MNRVLIVVVALGCSSLACSGTPPGNDAGVGGGGGAAGGGAGGGSGGLDAGTDAGVDPFLGDWTLAGNVFVTISGQGTTVSFATTVTKGTDGNYRFAIPNGCELVYVPTAVSTLHSLTPMTSCTVNTSADTEFILSGNPVTSSGAVEIVITSSDATLSGNTLAVSGSGTGKNGVNGAVYDMTFSYTGTRR